VSIGNNQGARQRPSEIEVVDVHVGGDLHRIVLNGIAELPGATVLEKMNYLRSDGDGLRQLLLQEPRGGHPSLYADLVVPPSDHRADAGFIIMELMGYPVISGTNTISTATALLETGRIPMIDGEVTLVLEAPGGLIDVIAECVGGKVRSVSYEANTPSFVHSSGLSIDVPGRGLVEFDLIWTGAFYPVVDAKAIGFDLVKDEEAELVRFAQDFLAVAGERYRPIHPVFGDEGPLSFVVFAGEALTTNTTQIECRVCCYELPRTNVCRSPAGVPTTAVLARLVFRDQLKLGESLRSESIFGSDLTATLIQIDDYHGYQGIRVMVRGTGWVTARSKLVVDFDDPLTPDAGLQQLLVHAAE
jgi:proline racemase